MKKSKLILIGAVILVFATGVVVDNYKNEKQSFQSVELGLAEISPLGDEGGYAVPASGESLSVYVPKTKLWDTKNKTYINEEFKVWFGPSNENKGADECELYRKTPNGNNWDRIETAGAGNLKSKTQTLGHVGTWHYRAHCGVEVDTCNLNQYNVDKHNGETSPGVDGHVIYLKVIPENLFGMGFKPAKVEAGGGGGANCKTVTYWGRWEYLQHPVTHRPPKAEISQNKEVTVQDETFRVTYGPKTTGYTGGAPDSCKLQRKHPNQTDWIEEDTSNGNTKSPQFSPAILGTWLYRAKCSNDGGDSEWVRLEHLVVNSDATPTALISVRNITQDSSWTSDDIIINAGDQVEVRWSSTNVTNCSGTNFNAGGNISGTDSDVAEPAAESSKSYTVSCTGNHGNASDSVSVSAGAGTVGEVTVDPSIVRLGDVTTVSWINATGACTLTGPGVNLSNLDTSGSVDVTINGESTYTLTCPGGTDTATVRVLPVIQET